MTFRYSNASQFEQALTRFEIMMTIEEDVSVTVLKIRADSWIIQRSHLYSVDELRTSLSPLRLLASVSRAVNRPYQTIFFNGNFFIRS